MKYIVFKGYDSTPGALVCKYNIFDVIDVDPMKEIYNQLRKYSFRCFYDMGADPRSMRKLVYSTRKDISIKDGTVLYKDAVVIYHTKTFFIFVPASAFNLK